MIFWQICRLAICDMVCVINDASALSTGEPNWRGKFTQFWETKAQSLRKKNDGRACQAVEKNNG